MRNLLEIVFDHTFVGRASVLILSLALMSPLSLAAYIKGGALAVPTVSSVEIVKDRKEIKPGREGVYPFGTLLVQTSKFSPVLNEKV